MDGLILAASLVPLHEARAGRTAPALARTMLWLGVAATLAPNAAYGWHWGVLGIVTSTWPAASFIGSVELVMLLIRHTAEPVLEQNAQPLAQVARDAEEAARSAFAATVAAGNPFSGRQLQERFGLNRAQVASVRAAVLPANGHKETVDAAS